MKPVAIIGIGSPYGADQTGWRAVEFLKQDHALQILSDNQIKFMNCDRPGLTLLDYVADSDCAILIDAIEGGDRGNVIRVEKNQLLHDSVGFSTHTLGVVEALTLGTQLNVLPQTIELIGIEVGDTSSDYLPEAGTFIQLKHVIYNLIQSYFTSR
ncbi:MAG: hydrogenase maturation protease [Gammaproteobacteria bacterium]|nr:hydrogenase maturation protease [Gammaproteobacteria bacterium]